MDQPIQYTGFAATIQSLFDKQSICNTSVGLLTGLPKPGQVLHLSRQVPDNQSLDKANENNDSGENSVHTTSGQVTNTLATTTNTTPIPPPPTAASPAVPASHINTDSTAKAPKDAKLPTSTSTAVICTEARQARPRSFSEVTADIKSCMAGVDAAPQSPQTVTESPPPMGGILGTIQAVTSQPRNNPPTGPQNGNTTSTMKPQQQKQLPKKTKLQASRAQQVRDWVAADARKFFPNPRFVHRGLPYYSVIFANEYFRVTGNSVFGRRLVLFSDGGLCYATRAASAAVVYRRFYNVNTTAEPPWMKESHGIIRLAVEKFETIALMAALEIVQKEVNAFFATPQYGASSGDLEPLHVYIFTDAPHAMTDLEQVVTRTIKDPKQKKCPHMLHLTNVWRALQNDSNNGKLKLEVHWVKGHNGAEGNELADSLATKILDVARRLHFARPASSSLGQGFEVFPLGQMEQYILSQSIARKSGAAIAYQPSPAAKEFKEKYEEFSTRNGNMTKEVFQQDYPSQIRKLLVEFFNETREVSEKQNELVLNELRKAFTKQLSKPSAAQLEVLTAQKDSRLDFSKLSMELSNQNRRQEAQDAQIESVMMALEETTSEWRKSSAAHSREIKAFRKQGEEMQRTLREETQEAVQAIFQAVVDGAKQTGGETKQDCLAKEEAMNEWRNALTAQSLEIKALRKHNQQMLRTLRGGISGDDPGRGQ
ncbi:hypothetical protein PG994_006591 [Apiospora phragmitis]|uniref:RNase H type-1 domain-containing protein n=1 Tax=Apiospora phragmitis TaxID=2905665 RepID=A0ABR1VFI8_9PEZI